MPTTFNELVSKRLPLILNILIAIQISSSLPAMADTTATLWKSYSEALLAQHYGEAEACAKQIIQLGKTTADGGLTYRQGLDLLASVYWETDRYHEAVELCKLELESARSNKAASKDIARILEHLAGVFEKMQQFAKAASTFSEAEQTQGPEADYVVNSAGEVHLVNPISSTMIFHEAHAYFEAGNYKQAEAVYERMKEKPYSCGPNRELAECYRREGKISDAERELNSFLAVPNITPLYLACVLVDLVRFYEAEKRFVEAREHEQKLLDCLTHPLNPMTVDDLPMEKELVQYTLDSRHLDQADSLSKSLVWSYCYFSQPTVTETPKLVRIYVDKLGEALTLRALVLRQRGALAEANSTEAEALKIKSGVGVDIKPYLKMWDYHDVPATYPIPPNWQRLTNGLSPERIQQIGEYNSYRHKMELDVAKLLQDLTCIKGANIILIMHKNGQISETENRGINPEADQRLLSAIIKLKLPPMPTWCREGMRIHISGDDIIRGKKVSSGE